MSMDGYVSGSAGISRRLQRRISRPGACIYARPRFCRWGSARQMSSGAARMRPGAGRKFGAVRTSRRITHWISQHALTMKLQPLLWKRAYTSAHHEDSENWCGCLWRGDVRGCEYAVAARGKPGQCDAERDRCGEWEA